MVLDKEPKEINFCESSETEITNIWEIKADNSVNLWSRKDDKLDRKNDLRNKKIAHLRESFLSPIKSRRHHYEIHCDYFYKSPEHREQFLEIIQAAGLDRTEPETQRDLYDSDGCYHSVTVPREKQPAEHYPTQLELNRNMSELGGTEINKEDIL